MVWDPPDPPHGFDLLAAGTAPPSLSILMPIYRQAPFIRQAVRSVLAQRGIALEILISDDASPDGTADLASAAVHEWLAAHGSPHRVLWRRGRERLWRDHLPLLAEAACCDLVAQAHGDDLSHPDRARVLAALFQRHPRAVLASSQLMVLPSTGVLPEAANSLPQPLPTRRYSMEAIVEGQPELIGCAQAWRRQALAVFPRLDRARAAVGHDRILPFRAALVGEVLQVDAPLLLRRDHRQAAHHLMFHEPETGGRFGWALARLASLAAMREDLAHAHDLGLVADSLVQELANLLNSHTASRLQRLLAAHRTQTRSGRVVAWLDEDQLQSLLDTAGDRQAS